MLLPGRTAAQARQAAASVMVRYLEDLGEDDPGRLGQTVESEAVKRKREEVELTDLEERIERTRVRATTDVARLTLGALTDLNLPVRDRD